MIYLYGLLEPMSPRPSDAIEGVTGPVAIVDLGTARLAYSLAETAEILPRRRLLLTHARVLETLATTGTVLPMRFGMVGDGLEELTAILARQAADIRAQFDALRGCAEYGIRVSFPREAALAATIAADPGLAAERDRIAALPGSRRMQAADFGRSLADRLDRRRAAAQKAILSELGGELAGHVLRAPDSDVEVLALDALVRATGAEDLARRVEAAARRSGFAPGAEPEVRLVGPGPAYSFVRLALDADRRAA